jgi:hypothetical protein
MGWVESCFCDVLAEISLCVRQSMALLIACNRASRRGQILGYAARASSCRISHFVDVVYELCSINECRGAPELDNHDGWCEYCQCSVKMRMLCHCLGVALSWFLVDHGRQKMDES